MFKKIIICAFCLFLLGCENKKNDTISKEDRVRVFAQTPRMTASLEILYPQGIIGLNLKPSNEYTEFSSIDKTNLPVLGAHSGINYEQIVALKPDLIIFSHTTDKAFIEPYEKVGIKTLQVDDSFENLEESLQIIGKALNIEEKTQKLIKFYKKQKMNLENLRHKVVKKPKIYFALGTEGLQTQCAKDNDSNDVALLLGAENVIKCEKIITSNENLLLNFERLIDLNPEFIFVRENILYKELINNPNKHWQSIKAVQDKKVYYAPNAPSNWLQRPYSIMRVIGYPWAFSKLHPDLLSEEEAKNIAKEFFAEFLRPLSDEDYTRLENK